MKYLTIIYLMFITYHCPAQILKLKDGVSLGKRSDFITNCVKGANKKLININGVEIEAYKYCECVCDNLIPTINSWEMEKAVKENKMIDLFLEDENLEKLMKCFEENYKINEDYKFEYYNDSEISPEIQNKFLVKNCVKVIMSDPEIKDLWTQKLAEEYCNCAINKLFSAGYTYKDILEIDGENSVTYNEIAIPCVSEILKDRTEFTSSNIYKIEDIKGEGNRSFIPLIDYFGQGYKIKISISGITKYYLFDTGASDLIIDREMERELLLNGVLKKENYLGKKKYILANNQTILAQEVKVNNIKIGNYTLNNVVLAIIDEGSLLCGKSFLDKFKKWEIDIPNNFLILYK